MDTSEPEFLKPEGFWRKFSTEPFALIDIHALAVAAIPGYVQNKGSNGGMATKDESPVRCKDHASHRGHGISCGSRVGNRKSLAPCTRRKTGGQKNSSLVKVRFHRS